MTKTEELLALAHTCCILYSARGEHEGEAWEELRVAIEQALEAATAAERERAAKVCEGMVRMDRHGYPDYPSSYAEQCAAAIRSTK